MMFTWLLLLFADPASACSVVGAEAFSVQPDATDTTAPLAPELAELEVRRGVGPRQCGSDSVSTSCDDIGAIHLTFQQPSADSHTADALGYRVRRLDGELPQGLTLEGGPWRGPQIWFHWIDEATFDQEAFAFTLEVTALDAAGNESAPLVVRVEDDGVASPAEKVAPNCGAAGCAVLPSRSAGWPLIAAVWGLGLLRRQPRRVH